MNKQSNAQLNTHQGCYNISVSVVDRAAKTKPGPSNNLNRSDFTKRNSSAPLHSSHDHHDQWAVKEHQHILLPPEYTLSFCFCMADK